MVVQFFQISLILTNLYTINNSTNNILVFETLFRHTFFKAPKYTIGIVLHINIKC